MMNNYDIAVLTKVNELAERYGFKSYDFVATFRHTDDGESHLLSFESGKALGKKRFDEMLTTLGVDLDTGTLRGSIEQVIDALDHALQVAPRKHGRA